MQNPRPINEVDKRGKKMKTKAKIDWQAIADGNKALKKMTTKILLEEALDLGIISNPRRIAGVNGELLEYRFSHKTESHEIALDSFWSGFLLDEILKMKGLR